MTKEDALLYFPYNNEIDIDDLYDELLFEQKQFLSNRMPISKVFNSRIARLKKIDEAFVFFGGKNEAALDELKLLVYDNDSIYESYQVFQKNLNQVRPSIKAACSYFSIIESTSIIISFTLILIYLPVLDGW